MHNIIEVKIAKYHIQVNVKLMNMYVIYHCLFRSVYLAAKNYKNQTKLYSYLE